MNNFYVYMWSDPTSKIPFYIGKGKANRAFNKHAGQRCFNKLKKLLEAGNCMNSIVTILKQDLDEQSALALEEQLIHKYKRLEDGGTLFNYRTSDKGGGGKIIDPKILQHIIDLYTNYKLSAKEIGCIYNINESTVLRRLKNAGIKTYARGSRYKFTEAEKQTIINHFNSGTSALKISKLYRCSIPTILTLLRSAGCCIKTKKQIKLEKAMNLTGQTL